MCYPDGDFLVGDRDVLLAVLDVGTPGVPVWISGPQFDAWKHTQLVIDVVPGRGGGFSLEAPEGMRFLSRGRAFTDEENRALEASPIVSGADYERGVRPPENGTHIVAEAVDACPVPGGAPARCRCGSAPDVRSVRTDGVSSRLRDLNAHQAGGASAPHRRAAAPALSSRP
jgi:hypothetical protein